MALRLAVGLLAGGGLLLEIALVRIVSVLHHHEHVYVVLSCAILGIGLGAALASWRAGLTDASHVSTWMALAALAALALVTTLTLGLFPGVGLVVVVAVPYVFVGLALAAAFCARSRESSLLYWADLLGGATAAGLAVPLLGVLGGAGGGIVAAGVMAGASVIARRGAFGPWQWTVVIASVAGGAGLLGAGPVTLDSSRAAVPKPAREILASGGTIVASRWDAFALTELIVSPAGALHLFMDGGAGSLVPDRERLPALLGDIGYFPIAVYRPGRVAAIGSGGGLDVALAVAGGAREILAVELNAASIEMVRNLGEYTGHVYSREGVTVLVDEGRAALRASRRAWDLILLSHVVSRTADYAAYALAESALYTVEAAGEFLDALTPGGLLAVKLYDEVTLARLFFTVLSALQREGLSESQAARRIVALVDPAPSPPVPLLLVRNEPFSPAESSRLVEIAAALGLRPLFVPGAAAGPPLDGLLDGRATAAEIVAAASANLRPVLDDRPFFFHFERGLPAGLQALLAAIVGAAAASLLVPLVQRSDARGGPGPAFFGLLGLAFMAAEIAMLHQVRGFVGHPSAALSAVLGALLVGAGLGSRVSHLVPEGREAGAAALAALAAALLLGAWTQLWPVLAGASGAMPLVWRAAAGAAALFPVAIPMGMPFPLGLRLAGRVGARAVAGAWATNGIWAVLGGVGATALAMTAGFSYALAGAAIGYLIASALAIRSPSADLKSRAPVG